ncbi:MAG: ABC transporter ATP-binding protein [Gorillibacterium sp.]|nr:ABC transporter ATP-binding protein [Gorillibacterium sp.]
MTEPSVVLSVSGLKKQIGKKLIIKGVSFEVKKGEVFGFLGPNGAGKTTTIRMLVNLIRPTEGTISICGVNLHKKPEVALANVGCIVENPELYGYMTGTENLEHFARMFPDVGVDRIREVVAIVGMDRRIHDKVKTYSLGMRQRLGIAQALLGRPKLLILDEPTNGLDPQGIKEMREFIRELARAGLSVFVSSHLLSEIQLMCDRVAIISQGKVIAVGGVDELLRQSENQIIWRAGPYEQAERILGPYLQTSPEANSIMSEAAEGPNLSLTTVTEFISLMPSEEIPVLNRKLVEAGVDVYSITIKNPTLEELFLRLTEGETIG